MEPALTSSKLRSQYEGSRCKGKGDIIACIPSKFVSRSGSHRRRGSERPPWKAGTPPTPTSDTVHLQLLYRLGVLRCLGPSQLPHARSASSISRQSGPYCSDVPNLSVQGPASLSKVVFRVLFSFLNPKTWALNSNRQFLRS